MFFFFHLALYQGLIKKLNPSHPIAAVNRSNATGGERRMERRVRRSLPAQPRPPVLKEENVAVKQIETVSGPTLNEGLGFDKAREFEVVFEVKTPQKGVDLRGVEQIYHDKVASGEIAKGGPPGSEAVPPVDPPMDLTMLKVQVGLIVAGICILCGVKCYFGNMILLWIKINLFDESPPKARQKEVPQP